MSKVDIYIPALLKFADDTISIPKNIQEEIYEHISSPFDVDEDANGFNYVLNDEELRKEIKDLQDLCIKVYYYHHRIVFHYRLTYKVKLKEKLSSDTRKQIVKHFDEKVGILIKQINMTIHKTRKIKDDNAGFRNNIKIIYYYSYPIIFQKYNSHVAKKLSSRIETMFFRIYIPNIWPLSFGSKAYVRISIPSIHIYHKSYLLKETKANVINAVFQTVLYVKKNSDAEECQELVLKQSKEESPFPSDLLYSYNIVNERTLEKLWDHAMNTMGGKMVDNQQAKVSKTLFVITIISLVIALVSLGIAFL